LARGSAPGAAFSTCDPLLGGTTFASKQNTSGAPAGQPDSTRDQKPSPSAEGDTMRILGILLVILGIIALAVPSITYMTTERAVDAGFFKVDYQKPHTIVLNPIVGIVATIAGLALLLTGRRTEAA
jgi:hypothetical protein